MFYLATECLINYLYSKMYNFNFISYCVICVILLLLSEINCAKFVKCVNCYKFILRFFDGYG